MAKLSQNGFLQKFTCMLPLGAGSFKVSEKDFYSQKSPYNNHDTLYIGAFGVTCKVLAPH